VQFGEEKNPILLHNGRPLDWASVYFEFGDRLLQLAQTEIGGKLGRHIDPNDVVQSVFRTFIRRAEGNGGVEGLPPGTDLWRLLLVITLNKIRRAGKYHRAAKRSVARTVSIGQTPVADDAPGESDSAILRLTVEELLERVEPRPRKILVMLLNGMSIDEIAAAMNRAPRTIYRAIESFQHMIEPLLNDE